MLENKRNYWRFVLINVVFGLGCFVISLVSTLSGSHAHLGSRQLYFGREILPDHVFYPAVAAMERTELFLAPPADKLIIRERLANKRLSAAEQLFQQGKTDLAWVTLGKAHQYLLQVNDDVDHSSQREQLLPAVIDMNQDFASQYRALRPYMTDSQLAGTTSMTEQLKYARGSAL